MGRATSLSPRARQSVEQGGDGGGIAGPDASTDNRIARWAGADGDELENSALGISDAGVLTGSTAGTTGATSSTSPLGSVTGSVANQDITAAGAALTADLPIAASTTVDVRVQIVIVDPDDSGAKRRIRGRILVERGAAGDAAIIGGDDGESADEWLHTDDTGSIYAADDPVALYGAYSAVGGNLRISIAAHADDDQIATVDFFPTVTPFPA